MLDFTPQSPGRTKLMRPSGVDAVMQDGDPVHVARTKNTSRIQIRVGPQGKANVGSKIRNVRNRLTVEGSVVGCGQKGSFCWVGPGCLIRQSNSRERYRCFEAGGQKRNGIWDEAAGSWVQRVANDGEAQANQLWGRGQTRLTVRVRTCDGCKCWPEGGKKA